LNVFGYEIEPHMLVVPSFYRFNRLEITGGIG
jgi:hypothetical protein